ncbi:MAG: hypothetical protein IT372_05180 [Polyangiaceae bacterium]|nr:hypothetical protein [Polyangiaceae bacterium]
MKTSPGGQELAHNMFEESFKLEYAKLAAALEAKARGKLNAAATTKDEREKLKLEIESDVLKDIASTLRTPG